MEHIKIADVSNVMSTSAGQLENTESRNRKGNRKREMVVTLNLEMVVPVQLYSEIPLLAKPQSDHEN